MAILEPSPTKYFSFFVLKFGLFTKKKSFKFSNQNVFVFRSLCISKLPQIFSCGQRVSCCRQKILLNRTNFPRENYGGCQTARGRFQPQEGHDVTFSETHFVGLMKRGWCSALALMSCLQSARRFATHRVMGIFACAQPPNATPSANEVLLRDHGG